MIDALWRRVLAAIEFPACECRQRTGRPRAALATLALAICALAFASSAAKADCRYGDSSEPERKEVVQADGQWFMCVDGKWIRDQDILAVVTVERANVWTDCCGTTDETDYVRAACDARRECSVPATQSWAGAEADPARRKHLWVSYHCAIGAKDLPTTHRAKQAEEGVPLNLSCSDIDSRRATAVTPGFDVHGYTHREETIGAASPAPAPSTAPVPMPAPAPPK